jgi:hypothetical protein
MATGLAIYDLMKYGFSETVSLAILDFCHMHVISEIVH